MFPSVQSDDVSDLKNELTRGRTDLERISALRDECIQRAWSKDSARSTYRSVQWNSTLVSFSSGRQTSLEVVLPQRRRK